MLTITAENVGDEHWQLWRNKHSGEVRELKWIDGKFEVLTDMGPEVCKDGFVMVDGLGQPYAVPRDLVEHGFEYAGERSPRDDVAPAESE